MLDGIRNYAHSHPLQATAGLIIALPGTYLYISGKSVCDTVPCPDAAMTTQSILENLPSSLTAYDTPSYQDLREFISTWSDRPETDFVVRSIRSTGNRAVLVLTDASERLGIDMPRIMEIVDESWAMYSPLPRIVSFAMATAAPGAFLSVIQKYPNSWAARHRTKIANALHVCALMTVANQRITFQDLLVAALVLVSFEALQQLAHESGVPSAIGSSALEAHVNNTPSKVSASPTPFNLTRKHSSSNPEALSLPSVSKDVEIEKMHKQLAELRKSEKAKDIDLKRIKGELNSARTTLTETFAEYASMRDELKMMRHTLGRDHQAEVYRKDIELFALRKSNEQKENCIKDREGKLDDVCRQHKTALEIKDTELLNLKERLLVLERQNSPKFEVSKIDSPTDNNSQEPLHAPSLRDQRPNSTEVNEDMLYEKDNEIARLKGDLAAAIASSETLTQAQVELKRAWDATAEVQQTLNEERKEHAQTQAELREAIVKTEEQLQKQAQRPPHRLSTIAEQNAQELEDMFNSAQQDNSRLYGEVESLEKRLREANSRVFMSEQSVEALREQLRLEKAINDDMETARPSLVHRVHFQRMEGQLNESREQLEAKEEEIKGLVKTAEEKDTKLEELNKTNEELSAAQTAARQENDQLRKTIEEIERTKEQLMLDHERLARQRSRSRTASTENTSARSSGATLITDAPNVPPVPPIPTEDEEPLLPARPVTTPSLIPRPSSIQISPERLRRDPPSNRLSMISTDIPPSELRHSRRKSLSLKGIMRKISRKEEQENADQRVPDSPPRTALMPKDKNALMRPKTAVTGATVMPKEKENEKQEERPKTAASTGSQSGHRRFFSEGRPRTAVTGIIKGEGKGEEEVERPKSRGWAASKKLVRKSMA